jgi:type IV secretion system protein TrbF
MARVLRSRCGTSAEQNAGWRLAAVGSAMLCGLLGISLGVVKSRAGVIRHREQAPIISPAVATSPDSQIVYFLARFIENARSLSSDPLVVRTSWRNAYARYVTGRGEEVLTEYGRDVAPFTRMGMRIVPVEIISTERLSKTSFII